MHRLDERARLPPAGRSAQRRLSALLPPAAGSCSCRLGAGRRGGSSRRSPGRPRPSRSLRQVRERQEIVVAAVDAIKAAREEIRGAAVDVRRAAEEFDTREFKLRQSYEKLDKAINSEAQRFNQWAFLKMGVLAGCVGAGVLFFLFVVLGLREALVWLGL